MVVRRPFQRTKARVRFAGLGNGFSEADPPRGVQTRGPKTRGFSRPVSDPRRAIQRCWRCVLSESTLQIITARTHFSIVDVTWQGHAICYLLCCAPRSLQANSIYQAALTVHAQPHIAKVDSIILTPTRRVHALCKFATIASHAK
jgi:hypothetical protein